MNALREATVLTLCSYETNFKSKIAFELGLDSNTTSETSYLADVFFRELIQSAQTEKVPGNHYHLLALATFLRREIYIYYDFPKNGCFEKMNIVDLQNAFYGSLLGNHYKYCPLFKNIIGQSENPILRGFYDKELFHYTSLIPIQKITLPFEPQISWNLNKII